MPTVGVIQAPQTLPNRSREVLPSQVNFYLVSIFPLLPLGLDHGRQLGAAQIPPTLQPAGLTRTRALGSLQVGSLLSLSGIAHIRSIGNPNAVSTIPTPVDPSTTGPHLQRSLRAVRRRASLGGSR